MELLNRLGIEEKFAISGGIAENLGLVKRLAEEANVTIAAAMRHERAVL